MTSKKKILIADDSDMAFDELTTSIHAGKYIFEHARSGPDCLEKIKSFKPDLIALGLMLPQIHGIEILQQLKQNPETAKIGVIVCTNKIMLQDYQASLENGADYFLNKPYDEAEFYRVVDLFFQGKLKIAPFDNPYKERYKEAWYTPGFVSPHSYLRFWGTRGSITASGHDYIRFGGYTSCLEIRQDKDLVIIDAGTGIRQLGYHIIESDEIKKIHIFLGHTHWDHIIGFPFFEPLYDSKYEITIYSPKGYGRQTKDLFTDMLAYEFFPVRLDEVQAKISFCEIQDQKPIQVGKLKLDFHYAFHPGVTFCFKIYTENEIIGYATDNEVLIGYHGHPDTIYEGHHLLEAHRSLISFFSECSLLIHEAQYTPKEYCNKVGWGHSSISNAAVIVKYAKVPEWIVTHHDPRHTDDELFKKFKLHKDIITDCKIPCHVQMAYDGLILSI